MLTWSTCAQDLAAKVTDHLAATRPHLHLAIFESQNLLLLVQKDKSLRRLKSLNLNLLLRSRVVNDKVFVAGLDHNLFVKLLQKFYFLADVHKLEFH